MLSVEKYDDFVDLEDEENRDFELFTKWRIKLNHFEYCEFDRRKLT